MVPSGWEVKGLENICKMQAGKFVKASDIFNEQTANTYPCFGGNGLRGYTESFTHDGLFSLIGRQGALCGNIKLASNKFHATEHAVVTTPFECIDKMWLYYTLVDLNLNKYATGQAQPGLSVKNLENIPVLTPNSFYEQQKIAKILSTWDKVISTTESLIDNSKQQKKALMQQLLTGKKRLLDDVGKQFDSEWEGCKLSEVAQITMGSSPKSDAYNEIGNGLPLLQGNADIKNRKSAPRIYTSQITKECQIGDILFSVRAPVGTVAISNHHACIGRGIASIKSKNNHSQKFLYQWFLAFELKWERYAQGSTFEAVNSNDIKSLLLMMPSEAEQQKIASVLTNADQEIELLEQQLADLQQEKKALMQQLLTGKRRVKGDGEVA